MRKKVWSVFAFISNAIGYFLIGVTGIIYANNLIIKETEEIFTVGLSALFIFSALSALCFSFFSVLKKDDEKNDMIYCGEKFLHSSLLIIQTILIKYAYNSLLNSSYIKNSWLLLLLIKIFFISVVTVCCLMGVFFALNGFQSLNDLLWRRVLQKIK